MSKRSEPNRLNETNAGSSGLPNAIQRVWEGVTPTMQRGLMLIGVGLTAAIVLLTLKLASSGTSAISPTVVVTQPSTRIVAATMSASLPDQTLGVGITATLAPPATLKPAATKAPTGTPLPTPTLAPTLTPLPTATPTSLPVPDWRATGKLTSIEYINTIVIERERPKTGLGVVIPGQDRIVLQVVGNIHAGIDLNKIKPANVRINGKSIRLVLPHAEIIAVELMPEASRIYEADQTLIFSDYQGLEIEAMDEARQKLRENSAHNLKMLEMAETLARLQLTELLRSLGYEQIEIVFE